jgi:hypothetical protein
MPLCDWDDMEVKGVAHLNIHCAIKSEEFAESRDRLTACYSVHSPALQENLPKLLMIRSLEALIKINVEGAEYPILKNLIDNGDITKIKNLQIQFHLFDGVENSEYDTIVNELSKTHKLSWRFPFVWENWEII